MNWCEHAPGDLGSRRRFRTVKLGCDRFQEPFVLIVLACNDQYEPGLLRRGGIFAMLLDAVGPNNCVRTVRDALLCWVLLL